MRPKILVALDFDSADDALSMARRLQPEVAGFKVGLGLLHGDGSQALERICELGLPVFADAKLHDIPDQVRRAAQQLGRRGARWVTAHASGGSSMLEAAVAGLADATGGKSGVLAVSVLTSLDPSDIDAVGLTGSVEEVVARLVKLAAGAGAEGAVCSVAEVGTVRRSAPELTTVTPRIRLSGGSTHDQKRVATIEEAEAAGSDYVVVGRAITRHEDPEAVAHQMANGMSSV